MGGSVTIAARFNDGEAICIDGWTNFMPWMIINDTTFSGNDSIVRETLMEAARIKHYGGPSKFMKSGYGIVVIDFKTREIHTIQGYCSFTDRWIGQLVDINATGWRGDKFEYVLSKEGQSLLDAGRVHASRCREDPEERLTVDKTMEILRCNFNAKQEGREEEYFSIRIDTSPFVVHDYGVDASITPIRKRMQETGFPMTRKDGLNSIFPNKRSK